MTIKSGQVPGAAASDAISSTEVQTSVKRAGPMKLKGEQRYENTGSVKTVNLDPVPVGS